MGDRTAAELQPTGSPAAGSRIVGSQSVVSLPLGPQPVLPQEAAQRPASTNDGQFATA